MIIMKLLKSIKDALKGFWKRHKYCLIVGFIIYVSFSSLEWYEFLFDPHYYMPHHFDDAFIWPFFYGVWRFISNLDALF